MHPATRVRLNVLVGLLSMVLNAAAAAAAEPTTGKTTASWFRAEPNLPRKKDMKADKLNRLIGSDYDEMWMSKSAIVTADVNATNAIGVKPETIGPDNLQLPEQLPAQYREMMRAWLVRRSSCPVEFAWTDLGKSFWPRWIRTGQCGRSGTMSCSWPPGMSCVPSSVRVLNILRWHCWLKNRKNKRKNQNRMKIKSVVNKTTECGTEGATVNLKRKPNNNKFRCLWIKVPYPVTEDCTCSCRKLDE